MPGFFFPDKVVLVKGDTAPSLYWRKEKVEKFIYGDANLMRGENVLVYQVTWIKPYNLGQNI